MRLAPLLEGPKQYVVPYFQRAYSWRRRQWNTLFDDILELYELGSRSSHFLGSMVLLAEHNEADPTPHTLVIDGQQSTVIRTSKEPGPSPIRDAYRTFRDAIQEQIDKGIELEALVEIIISQLSFV